MIIASTPAHTYNKTAKSQQAEFGCRLYVNISTVLLRHGYITQIASNDTVAVALATSYPRPHPPWGAEGAYLLPSRLSYKTTKQRHNNTTAAALMDRQQYDDHAGG